jgi:hypothetical protein
MLICWKHKLKYEFNDKRTSIHKRYRSNVFWLGLSVLLITEVVNGYKDYTENSDIKGLDNHVSQLTNQLQDVHSQVPVLTNELKNVAAENVNLEHRVSQLTEVISTNTEIPAPIRLATLNQELEQNSKDQTALQKSHKLISAAPINIRSLQAELESDQALQENQKRTEKIQQEIADIQKEKDEEAAAKIADRNARNQQWANQQLLKTESSFADHILPTFNFAIKELHRMLTEIAGEAQQTLNTDFGRNTDFAGQTPTIYESALTHNGAIVCGTNRIWIGTNEINPAWSFQISTTIIPLRASPFYDEPPDWNPPLEKINVGFGPHYTFISITSSTTNGDSVLTIEPVVPYNTDIGFNLVTKGDDIFYDQYSIKLVEPSGLENTNELTSLKTCNAEIEKALRGLIKAQWQQRPLTDIRSP